MEKTLTVGKTYTVTTASECSVTDSNGLVLCTASAGEQKAFVATTPTIIFSDDSASVVAVFKSAPALGSSGGNGGGAGTPGTPAGFGEVTATATSLAAGSTPTASVETSGFNTAKNFAFTFGIPQGEKGEKGDTGATGPQGPQGEQGEKGDTGLTSEQIAILTNYASSEGQNVSIGSDGTFSTQVGHTYVVTAESAVTVTQGDVTLNISAGTQQGFVATGTTATVSPTTCTVTEVFRAAATVALGGTSGGGDDLNTLKYNIADDGKIDITGDLSGLTNADSLFRYEANLKSVKVTMPEVTTAGSICENGSELLSFDSDWGKITKALAAFRNCKKMTNFKAGLSKLTTADGMFQNCNALSIFDCPLPALQSGGYMFLQTPQTEWNIPLPKLKTASSMFSYESNYGGGSKRLKIFNVELPSLQSGSAMFNGCWLDKASALRILGSIPTWTDSASHPLTIGIHVDHKEDADILAAVDAATANGWTVTVQWNGTASA